MVIARARGGMDGKLHFTPTQLLFEIYFKQKNNLKPGLAQSLSISDPILSDGRLKLNILTEFTYK